MPAVCFSAVHAAARPVQLLTRERSGGRDAGSGDLAPGEKGATARSALTRTAEPAEPPERRLTLDSFVPADANVLCEIDGDPEHRRRFDFPDDFVPSLQHSRTVIARWEEERRAGLRFPLAVRDASSGELLGGCELQRIGEATANLSYWTRPSHRRRGIASEAVRQVCALAFARLGFRRIELTADPDNVGSHKIAARHGFRRSGMRDGRVLYSLEGGDQGHT